MKNEIKNLMPKIKETLYRNPGVSRTQLAEMLGVTTSSIGPYVATLLDQGYVTEGKKNNISKPGAGRKQIQLSIVEDSAFVMGLELGPYGTYLCIADLKGNPVYKSQHEKAADNYDDMLFQITSIISMAIAQSGIDYKKFLGISLGLPGNINKGDGLIINIPEKPTWSGYHIVKDLQARLSIPVTIENNTRARALSANLFLEKNDFTYFIYFFISKGIACPVMINGIDITKNTAGAGEIGTAVIDYRFIEDEDIDMAHRLIGTSSEMAILDHCQKLMRDNPGCQLYNYAKKPEELEFTHVLHDYEDGDPLIDNVFKNAIRSLGMTIGNMINFLNPKDVYIDAYMMKIQKSRDILGKYISKAVYGLEQKDFNFTFLDFDRYRGALGSVADALMTFFIYS